MVNLEIIDNKYSVLMIDSAKGFLMLTQSVEDSIAKILVYLGTQYEVEL